MAAGADELVILGALGGEVDHLAANLLLLGSDLAAGRPVSLVHDQTTARQLAGPSRVELAGRREHGSACFAVGGPADRGDDPRTAVAAGRRPPGGWLVAGPGEHRHRVARVGVGRIGPAARHRDRATRTRTCCHEMANGRHRGHRRARCGLWRGLHRLERGVQRGGRSGVRPTALPPVRRVAHPRRPGAAHRSPAGRRAAGRDDGGGRSPCCSVRRMGSTRSSRASSREPAPSSSSPWPCTAAGRCRCRSWPPVEPRSGCGSTT